MAKKQTAKPDLSWLFGVFLILIFLGFVALVYLYGRHFNDAIGTLGFAGRIGSSQPFMV